MTAVFSFNRGELLDNCLRSIEQFSAGSEIIIFDDASSDPITRAVLHTAEKSGHTVVVNSQISNEKRGNLYRNLNRAVLFAQERGYRLIHLLQDDYQFVRYNEAIEDDVTRVFETSSDAAQVSVQFWKIASKASGSYVSEAGAYRLGQRPACSVGFIDVDRLASVGFQFQEDEAACIRLADRLNLGLFSLVHPVTTRVPWPPHSRYRVLRGRTTRTDKPLLIRPLDERRSDELLERNVMEEAPYAEDWCVPWGWRCWRPYGWTSSHWEWLRILAVVAWHRKSIRGLIPRRVGDLDGC